MQLHTEEMRGFLKQIMMFTTDVEGRKNRLYLVLHTSLFNINSSSRTPRLGLLVLVVVTDMTSDKFLLFSSSSYCCIPPRLLDNVTPFQKKILPFSKCRTYVLKEISQACELRITIKHPENDRRISEKKTSAAFISC